MLMRAHLPVVEEKDLHDPVFHGLVDALEQLLTERRMTPSAGRDALLYAQRRVDDRRVRQWRQSIPLEQYDAIL